MKKLLISAACLFLAVPFGIAAEPAIPALQAAKIASDYLKTVHENPRPYIVSLTLDQGALLSKKSAWIARWSSPLQVGSDKEIGLRVGMDGSIARLVEGKGTSRRLEPASLGIR